MSLQVWLPLNGDLHNQGLNSLTFSNLNSSTTTVDNAGKIGKCLNNNTATGGGLLSNTTIDLGQNQSMFCWVNFTSLTSTSGLGCGLVSQHRYLSNTGMGLTIKYVSSTTGYLSVNTGNGSGRSFNTYCATTLMSAGTWYHVGYTYDGSNIRLYVNGQLEKTQSYSNMSVPADYITVFCWSMDGSSGSTVYSAYKLNGKINDVRIYDHALSPKEVEEIAKGLVLHYKLNEPNSNLLTDLNDGWVIESGVTLTWDSNVNMYKISTNKTSTSRWGIYKNITLQANTTYTFSIDGMKGINNGTGAAFAEGATTSWPSYFASFTTTRERKSKTITIGDTDANCKIYLALTPSGEETTKYTYFALPKLEKSNFMTSWVPNAANTNNIYDSSGYSNNGTVIGSLTAAAGSPRYDIATQFPGTAYSTCTSPSSEARTISVWAKWDSIPSGQSIIYVDYKSKTGLGLMSTGILCSSCGLSSYTFSKSNIVANVWYHFVIVCPNGPADTARKLYINGVEQTATSSTSNWTHALDELQVGKRSTTSDGFSGKISDFRIYATALTAEQVADLYHTSMSVDSSGNIHARELKEV